MTGVCGHENLAQSIDGWGVVTCINPADHPRGGIGDGHRYGPMRFISADEAMRRLWGDDDE